MFSIACMADVYQQRLRVVQDKIRIQKVCTYYDIILISSKSKQIIARIRQRQALATKLLATKTTNFGIPVISGRLFINCRALHMRKLKLSFLP